MTNSPDKTATPTADESAELLTAHIRLQDPFFFVRYGDGALECIFDEDRSTTRTCDGEFYSRGLGLALLDAWSRLESGPGPVFAGDWQSASFGGRSGHNREQDRWLALTSLAPFTWLHFETLLLMRESTALVEFYRAVRADTRRKLYLGAAKNAGAARFLGAEHMFTPMVPNLFDHLADVHEELERRDFDVLLYGAGMAGNVAAVESWSRHQDRTYISLGSALDPLFSGQSRSQQLPKHKLRAMFRGML